MSLKAEGTEVENRAVLSAIINLKGGDYLLGKARGLYDHGGGKQLALDSPNYQLLADYVALETGKITLTPSLPEAPLEKHSRTFRRASLLLTGTIPSEDTLEKLDHISEQEFTIALRELLNTPNLKPFLMRGANDQLLTRSLNNSLSLGLHFSQYYIEYFQKNVEAFDVISQEAYARAVMGEVAEAPLELIANVVLNDQPYSNILTAPYAMVSVNTANVYQADVTPAPNEYLPTAEQWQRLSSNNLNFPSDNWNVSRNVKVPHSGLLTDLGFLQQFASTSTNRNRARARWTYQLFLGVDIENSAARNLDSSTLVDPSATAQSEPTCQVCHQRLDPVAAAFQHFGDLGIYHESAFGIDSLPQMYKYTPDYKRGDTWYKNQAPAGFENQLFDNSDPLKQLATAIIADERFGEGAVKFWWPNLMGDIFTAGILTDQDFTYRQLSTKKLADEFRANQYDLKALLTAMVLSPWFRADITQLNPYKNEKRLLTPEEFVVKTSALTGINDPRFMNEWNLIYGGIDSYNVTKRQRDISHMMFRVASRHAITNACAVLQQEFAQPADQRKLFRFVELENDRLVTDSGNTAISQQLIFLMQRMWGEKVAAGGKDVTALSGLFSQLYQNAQNRLKINNADACALPTRIAANAVNVADSQAQLSAWRGILISLMTDYNYLYE